MFVALVAPIRDIPRDSASPLRCAVELSRCGLSRSAAVCRAAAVVVRDVSADVPGGRLIRWRDRTVGEVHPASGRRGVTTASRGRVSGWPHTVRARAAPLRAPFSGQESLLHLAGCTGCGRRRTAADRRVARATRRDATRRRRWAMSKGMSRRSPSPRRCFTTRLLVPDEASTGLDVIARSTLDDAVAERVAARRGDVRDHDPARLAGREASLAGGRRWAGDGDGRRGRRRPGGGGRRGGWGPPRGRAGGGDDVVTIELAGMEAAGLAGWGTCRACFPAPGPRYSARGFGWRRGIRTRSCGGR